MIQTLDSNIQWRNHYALDIRETNCVIYWIELIALSTFWITGAKTVKWNVFKSQGCYNYLLHHKQISSGGCMLLWNWKAGFLYAAMILRVTFLKNCAESFLSGFASTQRRVKNNLTQLKLLARDRLIDKRHLKLCTISVLMLWYTIWKSQCYVSVQCSQYLVSCPIWGGVSCD